MTMARPLLLVALLAACGGEAVVDAPGSDGGGGTTGSSTSTTGPATCPTSPLPQQGTACSSPGLSCVGDGSDPYCWDWTCICNDAGVFDCYPGACA